MKFFKTSSLLIWLSVVLVGCSVTKTIRQSTSNQEMLQTEIAYLISDPNLQNAQIGLYIESLKDGKNIFRYNEHKLFIPASNMKLYTTATSLIKLTPAYRYSTIFYSDGQISEGKLNGNLIIRGMGDPTISGRFREGDIFAYFKDWADSLKQRGIEEITGDLIGDESYFSGNKLGEGWNWDDEPFWYSAQTCALSFNDNCVDITVSPGDVPGEAVEVQSNPVTDYVQIQNKAKTVDADSLSTLEITRLRAQNIIEISGNLSSDSKPVTESITIENPARYFTTVFYNVLSSQGIKVSGEPKTSSDIKIEKYQNLKILFIHKSPELPEIIKVVNKPSHNLYAEQLLKTLGAEFQKTGSTESGVQIVNNWLHSIGIAPNEFIMVDGSGLSRKNYVSPFSTATLLRYMYKHPYFEYYYNSLPVAGVDGTLKNRMRSSRAEGNVHAKTGYVRHTRNLSGYVNDLDNNTYIFVIMLNHYSVPTPYVNVLQDKICILLSNFSESK